MTRLLKSFWAFLRVGIAAMLQYRGEIILWALWGLVNPAVLYAVWSAATESSGKAIAGYDRGTFAAYYVLMMIVGHLTAAWDAYEMAHLVRSGEMSPKLLRPILPMWEAIATNLAYKITTLAFLVPMWILFSLLVRPTFHTEPWQLAVGLVALLLGAAANFVLNYAVALLAFWSPRLDAIGEMYFGLGVFFGGRFAPIDALPAFLGSLAAIMPFKWMFAFPCEVLIGRVTDPRAALHGIVMQLVWLVGSIVVFRVTWAAAVRRYTAVSG